MKIEEFQMQYELSVITNFYLKYRPSYFFLSLNSAADWK
jgi:hypothetical protein